MTCEQFERWLDDGAPDGGAAADCRAHAATCPACAAAAAAARELETRFAAARDASVHRAPAGFTERVMERVADVARTSQAIGAWHVPAAAILPWWVRAAAEPATALAFAVAALLLWKRDAMLVAATSLLAQAGGPLAATVTAADRAVGSGWRIPAALQRPEVLLGAAFAVAPALFWLSWRLWRWGEDRAAISAR